jgi:putative PIN family toxin of toxin-antitoxin system
MRVIIDSNIAIAAVASHGLCEVLMELCLEQHQIILCEGIMREIERKLRTKLSVPAPVIAEYLRVLRNNAEMLEPETVPEAVCRDHDDLMILGLVSSGKADVVVTGDKDLLVLGSYNAAQIVTPRAFWESNRRVENRRDGADNHQP